MDGYILNYKQPETLDRKEKEVQKRLMEAGVGAELRLGVQGRPLRRWLQLPSEERGGASEEKVLVSEQCV